ncbi:unnamed protein product, partial [Coregonus sp. 'balchen']
PELSVMGKAKAHAGLLARRPDNSAFKHQRLPVWSPMLTAHTRKDSANANQSCNCTMVFNIEDTLKRDMFFYNGLINFHQNIYMYSRDDGQMFCLFVPVSLTLTYHSEKGGPVVHVPLFRKDITWYTDKNVKLLNPPVENKTLTLAQVFEGTARPLYWQKAMCDLDPWYHNNNGFINEDLIVWMREAAFPNFKKLYEGCRLGTTATISPTWSPSGAERKWHCPVSWVGGQNNFLTVAYQITDCLILLLAVIFTAIWWKFGMNGQNMEE